MKHALHTAVLAALSLLLLSGCQTAKEKAVCPTIAILANTSELTAFKPGQQGDPAGELYRIQMTGVKARCDVDIDEGTTDSDIDISFRASHAPSGETANFTAPYYVAIVLDGKTILTKKILATAFSFGPGESTVTFTENVPSFPNRLQNGVKPYQYTLLVGLQLTREQLDYLKHNGRLTP